MSADHLQGVDLSKIRGSSVGRHRPCDVPQYHFDRNDISFGVRGISHGQVLQESVRLDQLAAIAVVKQRVPVSLPFAKTVCDRWNSDD